MRLLLVDDSPAQCLVLATMLRSAELADLTRAFDAGAIDYITNPPNKIELLARLRSALRLEQETDQRKAQARELLELMEQLRGEQHRSDQLLLDLVEEQERSTQLLLNILPGPIAQRLKQGERDIADSYEDVTVLFVDLVNFTSLASDMPPASLVSLLNQIFSCFDSLVERYGVEKIKTIGDAYMVVGGLLQDHQAPVAAVANLALAMHQALQDGFAGCPPLAARIGIHCGPVTAGIIGAAV